MGEEGEERLRGQRIIGIKRAETELITEESALEVHEWLFTLTNFLNFAIINIFR